MAVFPCEFEPHRYPGPQRSAYLTQVYGQTAETRVLRLCERHCQEFLQACRELLTEVDDDSQFSVVCDECDDDRDGALFIKVFPDKEEPRQFAFDGCTKHLIDRQHRFRFASGRPMKAR